MSVILTKKQIETLTGKICPYCHRVPEYVDSAVVYRRSYGMIYLCRECRAWVGCHPGTDKPLGRLANKELRDLKIKAHDAFDRVWKDKDTSRRKAYAWLAEKLKVPPEYCHIGMFNENTCQKVIEICKNKTEDL